MRMGGARPNAVELTDAYVRAFEEWRETGEDAIWDTSAGDGIDRALRLHLGL